MQIICLTFKNNKVMKLVLKNSSLVFKGAQMEPVSVGPSLSIISDLTAKNSGDATAGYKGANTACKGTNIQRVTKINFKVSDGGGEGTNRGYTVFFKMTVVNNQCTGMVEVARYTYNAADDGTIKTLNVDISLGENDYIALGGNFYYTSSGGEGTVNAHHADEAVVSLANQWSGYNLEGYRIVSQ